MTRNYKPSINRILIILLFTGFCHFSLFAQGTKHKTIRKTGHIKGILKDTAAVMNFKVCKNDYGYVICSETPNSNNSTFGAPVKAKKYPVYEAPKSEVIILKGKPEVPKVQFPMTKPGPEIQSGAWLGVESWNGVW